MKMHSSMNLVMLIAPGNDRNHKIRRRSNTSIPDPQFLHKNASLGSPNGLVVDKSAFTWRWYSGVFFPTESMFSHEQVVHIRKTIHHVQICISFKYSEWYLMRYTYCMHNLFSNHEIGAQLSYLTSNDLTISLVKNMNTLFSCRL